jgi:hypothetical protein
MMGAVPGRLLFVIALLWASEARAVEGAIEVPVGDTCPRSDQIVGALEARLPGVTTGEPTWRLELERHASELTLRLRGTRTSVTYLERRLDSDARSASPEVCAALAETAAQVVVRYLREIGYRPPPPPPLAVVTKLPPVPLHSVDLPQVIGFSAGYLGVDLGLRAAGSSRGEVAITFQHQRAGLVLGRVLAFSAGVTTETTRSVPGTPEAALRLRAFPLRLSLGLGLDMWRGWLGPELGAGIDLLSFQAAGLTDARSGLRVEPVAEAGLWYLWSGSTLFARGGVLGGASFHAHDFDAGLTQPVFRTPGAYLRAQFELGFVLWKNPRRRDL